MLSSLLPEWQLQFAQTLMLRSSQRFCALWWRQEVPSSIMRKFIYKSGRTQSAQGRETNYLVAEDRERVKGGEAACEALDVNSVFCYQPASSSCISMYFMLMYFFPPHWVPAT